MLEGGLMVLVGFGASTWVGEPSSEASVAELEVTGLDITPGASEKTYLRPGCWPCVATDIRLINLLWVGIDSHSGVVGVIATVLDVISRRVAAAFISRVMEVGVVVWEEPDTLTFWLSGSCAVTMLLFFIDTLVVVMVMTGVRALD